MQTRFFIPPGADAGEQRLTEVLRGLQRVASVEVNPERGRVVVEYSPDTITPLKIRQAALATGFHPTDVPVETGETPAPAGHRALYGPLTLALMCSAFNVVAAAT